MPELGILLLAAVWSKTHPSCVRARPAQNYPMLHPGFPDRVYNKHTTFLVKESIAF